MQLRRIEISAFRCFKDSVVIDNIGDGVTLLVGDNEEGKSTMLAALQTVLFEKHSVGGAVADAMLPYGSKVRPEIRLEFDHDGVRYRLYKAFCQKPAANLEAESGGRWSGDEVEERLPEMLEFTPPGKGGTKPHHRGLQSLFWVEQGLAYRQPNINETAQTSLAGALEAEVGTVTGGERGRTLIKRIVSRVNDILTPKTRKPAGTYKDAIDQVTEARGRSDKLAVRLKDFEGKGDVLTQKRELLAKLEADDPIGAADKRLKEANDANRNVEGLESSLKPAEATLEAAQSEHKLAKLSLDQRQKNRREANKADQGVESLKRKESAAQEAVNGAQKAFDGAEDAHRKVKAVLDAAEKDAAAARRLADLLRKIDELKTAQDHLKKAESADLVTTKLTADAKASPFTPEALDGLQRLVGDARDAAAQLKAVATGVEFEPDEGRRVLIDGEAVDADAITLTERTRIELEGYGAIRVTPGGEDLSSRREVAEAAAAELKRELENHGADDLKNAVQQGGNRQSWLTEAEIHRNTVEAHAPEGLDALRNEVAGLAADVKRIEGDLGDADVPVITADEAANRADDLAQKLKDAQTEERGASDELQGADGALKIAKNSLTAAADRREEVENTAKTLRNVLDQSAEKDSDKDLEKVLDDATKAAKDASKAADKIKHALAESDPDGARRELEAATNARDAVENNLQDLRRKVRDLEFELRILGQDDTAAELEVAKGELERAEAQKARLSHEAVALTLLHETLVEEEQAARETFLRPVRDRVEPYLKRFFPGSELVLDDQTLEITHLRRSGQDEPYQRLSIGTREQLAVLARLAFADLLSEHGKQSPIILDDALVFSDDRRFEEMQRILDRAAERLQIILLTCHERAYFEHGWATKRLQDCRS